MMRRTLFLLIGILILLGAAVEQAAGSPVPAHGSPRLLQVEATDDPCAPPRLTVSVATINVRSGPGAEYNVIATAPSGSSFLILGRAETRRYYVILLADGTEGWIFADIVDVSGDVANMPLVTPPLVDGAPPEPGPLWEPVSLTPPCTLTPVAATPTPAPSSPLAATPVALEADDRYAPWSVPANLSNSGGAGAPQQVIDAGGTAHVLWWEERLGFRYGSADANADEPVWQTGVVLGRALPFGGAQPTLLANGSEILAFWIDAAGELSVSRVGAAALTVADAWSPPVAIMADVLAFAAVVTEEGALHVVAVGTPGGAAAPAGVYHSGSSEGVVWSPPALVYASEYLRNAAPEGINVRLATAAQQRLVVVWDNPLLKRVLRSRSVDAGATWSAPQVVDSRRSDDATDAVAPRAIQVFGSGETMFATWQAGHGDVYCNQLVQVSADGGATWSETPPVFGAATICPTTFALVGELPGGDQLFMAQVLTNAYLLAWDGARWSLPQVADTLATFVDPVTLDALDLRCHDLALGPNGRLWVTGCSQNGPSDVWALTRSLAVTEAWFESSSPWSAAADLAATAGMLQDPVLLTTADGGVHAFWVQEADSPDGARIYHAQRRDGSWSAPVALFAPPAGKAANLHALQVNDAAVMLLWEGGAGTLYHSQAASDEIGASSAWQPPAPLPAPDGAYYLSVAAAPDGRLLVVYSVPINENRGVYLLRLDETGLSWSEPVRIFDGAAAGWETVGPAQVARAGDGTIHLLLSRALLERDFESRVAALYYTRSLDSGDGFGAPLLVTEGHVLWSRIVSLRSGALLRFWQQQEESGIGLWYQLSVDGGTTWDRAVQYSAGRGLPLLAAGRGGGLGWLFATPQSLLTWVWDGAAWQVEAPLLWERRHSPLNATAALAAGGRLVILWTTGTADGGLTLHAAERALAVADGDGSPLPLPTPSLPEEGAEVVAEGDSEEASTPVSGVDFSTERPTGSGVLAGLPGYGSSTGRLVYAVVPVFAIILLLLGLTWRRLRR